MKKYEWFLAVSLGASLASPAFSANEAVYDPDTLSVVIPKVIVRGNPGIQYRVELKRKNRQSNEFVLGLVRVSREVDTEVDKYLTIETGLYGQAVAAEEGRRKPLSGMEVLVFRKDGITVVASTETDDNGFYQLGFDEQFVPPPGGPYHICFREPGGPETLAGPRMVGSPGLICSEEYFVASSMTSRCDYDDGPRARASGEEPMVFCANY